MARRTGQTLRNVREVKIYCVGRVTTKNESVTRTPAAFLSFHAEAGETRDQINDRQSDLRYRNMHVMYHFLFFSFLFFSLVYFKRGESFQSLDRKISREDEQSVERILQSVA